MVLNAEQIDDVDKNYDLQDFSKSNKYFIVGYNFCCVDHYDLGMDSFKRGIENDGCVACISYYLEMQYGLKNNIHLSLPLALEGSIRGNVFCMNRLIDFYGESEPAMAHALQDFWAKRLTKFIPVIHTKGNRKEMKEKIANICWGCKKEDSKNKTFVKCGICKHYSYCGTECQECHWRKKEEGGGNHIAECRQLAILRQYYKPYARNIREAIIRGDDPKTINRLQTLRTMLGLNRPKEQYEELLLHLENDNMLKRGTQVKVKGLVTASVHNGKIGIITKMSSVPGEGCRVGVKLDDHSGTVLAIKIENLEAASKYEYLTARKDGTVHIGSTPGAI